MPVLTRYAFPAVVCVLLAPCAATATQLYKWVDQQGVTNYSDQPPAVAVRQHGTIQNHVSVYTPDPLLKKAIAAEHARAIDDLRTGRRSREMQEDWLARQYLAAARPYPDYGCNASSDPHCAGYTPYVYPLGVPYLGGRRFPRVLPQIVLPPGTTAGNVTGGTGYMPGTSAFAPGASMSAPASAMAAPAGGASGGARVAGGMR